MADGELEGSEGNAVGGGCGCGSGEGRGPAEGIAGIKGVG